MKMVRCFHILEEPLSLRFTILRKMKLSLNRYSIPENLAMEHWRVSFAWQEQMS